MNEMKLKIKSNVILNKDNIEDLKSILTPPDMGWEYEGQMVYTTELQSGYCIYIYEVNLRKNLITLLEIRR